MRQQITPTIRTIKLIFSIITIAKSLELLIRGCTYGGQTASPLRAEYLSWPPVTIWSVICGFLALATVLGLVIKRYKIVSAASGLSGLVFFSFAVNIGMFVIFDTSDTIFDVVRVSVYTAMGIVWMCCAYFWAIWDAVEEDRRYRQGEFYGGINTACPRAAFKPK